MSRLSENHKYSQQATKTVLFVFFCTSGLIAVLIAAMIILKIWWPIFIIALIVMGWYVFSSHRKTVPLYDLTDNLNIVVDNNEWITFKKQYPNQVVANGKKLD